MKNWGAIDLLIRSIQRKVGVIDDGDIRKVDTLKRIVAALDELEDRRATDDTQETVLER